MPSLATSWMGEYDLVPLAIAVIAVALLMSSLRKRQRRTPGQSSPRPTRSSTRDDELTKAQLRRDIDSLLVELQELSRRISAEIDMRFTKLETVMKDADRRIATLSRLTGEEEVEAASAARAQPTSAPKPSPEVESPRSVPQPSDTRHAVVYQMADAGKSPVQIAQDLGKTPGEVELILNLRKQA